MQDYLKPLGYKTLVDLFSLKVPAHFRWSYISQKWQKKRLEEENEIFLYPPSYELGNDPFLHLEFALKHEGLNLLILKRVFQQLDPAKTEEYIKREPTGKYSRIIWFLYENLLNKTLELPDIKQGNYVSILDPKDYYVAASKRSPRHRVNNNLLGSFSFCPVVRKTALLLDYEKKELSKHAQDLIKKYPKELLVRSMQYLYTKETLSSWEIEREKPNKVKEAKFSSLLQKAGNLGSLSKNVFVDIQKEIVDPRFVLEDYRSFQNYVGEEPRLGQLIVHYITPRPCDVDTLMEGLITSYENSYSSIHPVIAAALLAFGFVFIHPFWDGNGRLHRFLIHYALARANFTPKEVVFPISAAILQNRLEYDQALESFSKPLLSLISYSIDPKGQMTVDSDTRDLYQYSDYTFLAEYLFSSVEKTITDLFEKELIFLQNFDKAKARLKEIVDMPDRKIDLFIHCVKQNDGHLSAKKREDYFSMLTDAEIKEMEKALINLI